ncbi:MAG: TldD/PmbA family protein [Desulfurococcaceae archaeon]
MQDLLERLVDLGRERGCEYVEARFHEISSRSMTSRNGELVNVNVRLSRGVGVRVLVNGSLGFSATNDLTREGLEKALESAISRAKGLAKLYERPLSMGPARVGRAKYEVAPKRGFDEVSPEEKLGLLRDLWNISASATREAKVRALNVSYNESVERKVVVNSDGGFVESSIPRLYLFYNVVLGQPSAGYLQRAEEYGGSGGFELIRNWGLEEAIEREVKTLEGVLLTARAPPSEPVDVIVGSEIVGLMAHESAGHPSEADRVLGREMAQAGRSFIRPGMGGRRIGNELATVVDDPTIPGSYGYFLFDDEAVAARPKYLYKEGIINEHLHNRATAKVFGVESNGSARAMDYGSEPIVRMSNTYLTPGDRSFDELIEDIELGVYLKSYMEWNIDDERWNQRYVGLEAYLIERGELRGYVKNPVLEITTGAFYSGIVAKGKELKFYAGTCGKGEPPQGVPVWFGGPDVRLEKVRLGVAQ